jgi:hypothetical protein
MALPDGSIDPSNFQIQALQPDLLSTGNVPCPPSINAAGLIEPDSIYANSANASLTMSFRWPWPAAASGYIEQFCFRPDFPMGGPHAGGCCDYTYRDWYSDDSGYASHIYYVGTQSHYFLLADLLVPQLPVWNASQLVIRDLSGNDVSNAGALGSTPGNANQLYSLSLIANPGWHYRLSACSDFSASGSRNCPPDPRVNLGASVLTPDGNSNATTYMSVSPGPAHHFLLIATPENIDDFTAITGFTVAAS